MLTNEKELNMRSFHNDPKIKEKYLSRVIKHREMDNIIKGTGWENGKGCAVGCTLENYDHSLYPIELGIPEWLAKLEDMIFENLPNELAMTWPERFLDAINIGICIKEIEKVKHKLSIRRLNRLIKLQNELKSNNKELKEVFDQVISSIDLVIKCHELELNKNYCDWSAARSAAESAARSAAWSAESAAESAASAAWSAAQSAASEAWSAESAAWSAESAAESAASAAESAAWIQESNDLIELLKGCRNAD